MSNSPEQPEASESPEPVESAEPVETSEPIEPRKPALITSTESNSVHIRRAPKYGRFMILGGGFGAIVTFILTMSFPADPSVGVGALFGYFSLFGIPAGVALGAIIALITDRMLSRRSSNATVEHETVEPELYEGTLEE